MDSYSLKQRGQYGGIDWFRLLAAVLIVANHTSPLLSYDPTADFILTRIIARVGVPFFFMATGFFLVTSMLAGGDSLRKFLLKTTKLYLVAMLLYLPVLVYKGYFAEPDMPLALLKDIVFDGTLYHLWYLPAVMLGAWIVYILLRAFTMQTALAITALLYVIGLLGDSYYGLVEQLPVLQGLYAVLFQFFDYTRNGLFFAPLYLLLGGMIAGKKKQMQRKTALTGVALSSVLLLAEGLTLHHLDLQRHDSMYLMLVPVMVFLFHALLTCKGASNRQWRTIAMAVYILHPLCIILVRGFAKVAGLEWLLIENSLAHYLAVVALSVFCSVLLVRLFVRKKKPERTATGRAWIELNLDHLGHNLHAIRQLLPSTCEVMAVVKANAYGHGDAIIANELNRLGVRAFAVASLSEGIRLRRQGIKGDILVLGYTHPDEIFRLIRHRLIQTVLDADYAHAISGLGKTIRVHVKIDTGMRRLGEPYDNLSAIRAIYSSPNLSVEGIYTHLAVSDSLQADDRAYTDEQIRRFQWSVEQIKRMGFEPGKVHVHSSYGVLNDSEGSFDFARMGIALYGLLSRPDEQTRRSVDLRPVLSLKARVAAVKELAPGDSLGYGRAFTATRPTRIAVLAIGYADGIPRSLSGSQAAVLIHGKRAPVIGMICMDQMMVDVTEIPETRAGDVSTIIGQDGTEVISAEQMAAAAGTIANEWLSRLGTRLERVAVRSKQ